MKRALQAAGFFIEAESLSTRNEGCLTAKKNGVRVTFSWSDHTHHDGRKKTRLRWWMIGTIETTSVTAVIAAANHLVDESALAAS